MNIANTTFLSICLCLTITFSPSFLWGQAADYLKQKSFQRIDVSDGLPSNIVHGITQDQNGFMWFGTEEGLCRYDGQNFKIFTHDPTDSTSLPGNAVWLVYCDSQGNLWVSSNGLSRFDFQTEKFERIEISHGAVNADKLNFITQMHEDRFGNLWLGTLGRGFYKYNPRLKKLTTIVLQDPQQPTTAPLWVFSISSYSPDKILLATTNHQLVLIDIQTDEMTRYSLPTNTEGDINTALVDRKNRLWFTMIDSPLRQITLAENGTIQTKTFEAVKTTRYHSGLKNDRDGNLWIGTVGDGLYIFDPDSEMLQHYLHDSKDAISLPDNDTSIFFEDRSGNIWIATNQGVAMWARWKKPFRHFSHNSRSVNSINKAVVTGIDQGPRGNLWISTWNTGFSRFDPSTGNFRRYDPGTCRNCPGWVFDIMASQDGSIWMASTFKSGLLRYYPASGAVRQYLHNQQAPGSLAGNIVRTIYEDLDKTVWIGLANKGLNRYDPASDAFQHFGHDPENQNSLSNANVTAIYQHKRHVLWVGTGNGLNRLNIQSGLFTQYFPPDSLRFGSSRFEIYALHQGQRGKLWIGSNSGLYLFNPKDEQYTAIAKLSGNDAPGIFAILEDKQANLWLQTVNSIIKFHPQRQDIRRYDNGDNWIQRGLRKNEWLHSSQQLQSGEMVFGGSNGITIFDPAAIKDNPDIPPVHITGLRLFYERVDFDKNPYAQRKNGDSLLTRPILYSDQLTLKHSENTFTFEFATLDYTRPEANHHAFILDGFQDNWVNTENHFATYTNIPPGDYVFRVKGAGSDGLWNECGDAIAIKILPPWWQSGSAYFIYAILLGLALYGWRRVEMNRIKMQNQLQMKELEAQKLLEIDTIKNRFFANISHEFRTPLTLILGPLEDVISRITDKAGRRQLGIVHKNAGRLLHLINQLLDLSRLESGQMSLCLVNGEFVHFLKGLVVSFSSLAEQKKITLDFNCEADTASRLHRDLYYDRDKIEKVIYNLLANALKFTPAGGTIEVNVSIVDEPLPSNGQIPSVVITISDSGIGIPADQIPHIFDRFHQVDNSSTRQHQGTGIGLALTMEIVKRHRGTIDVRSEVDSGTQFRLTLPLGKSAFKADDFADEDSGPAAAIHPTDLIFETAQPLPESSLTTEIDEAIVLIIDDHSDMRHYIRGHLADHYRILEAADGAEGVAAAGEAIPDLIISDVMMPELDGYQVCEALKSNVKTSHIPIILLTARAGEESKLTGLETGADDYLVKPFSPRELKARVKNLVEQRRKLRERFRREGMLHPPDVATTSVDEKFLRRLMELLENNMANEDYNVEQLSKSLNIGMRQLQRKVRALTGESPLDLMRGVRLERARQLLEKQSGNIAQIAYEVGFNNPSYFARCFAKRFGVLPSEFVKNLNT